MDCKGGSGVGVAEVLLDAVTVSPGDRGGDKHGVGEGMAVARGGGAELPRPATAQGEAASPSAAAGRAAPSLPLEKPRSAGLLCAVRHRSLREEVEESVQVRDAFHGDVGHLGQGCEGGESGGRATSG